MATIGRPRDPHTTSANAGRLRAERQYRELGICESCGRHPAHDRHHKDGNTLNNERSNVALLCRKCHAAAHDRAGQMRARRLAAPRKPPTICINCGVTHTPTRKGRCQRCADYRYRHGAERPVDHLTCAS